MNFALPDPRVFPRRPGALAASASALVEHAEAALSSGVAAIADRHERLLIEQMASCLLQDDVPAIHAACDAAPSLGVLRMLSRSAARAHVQAARVRHPTEGLQVNVFALPLIIVTGSPTPLRVPGALPNLGEVVEILRTHRALRGNQTFGLSNALAASAALALDRSPATLDWWRLSQDDNEPVDVERAPIDVVAQQEQVHLRFLLGRALAAPGIDLLDERECGPWAMPLTAALARQLGGGALSLLALPRPPREPLSALLQGRIAQREVSLQLFVSNAIRKFRQSVGEPKAVISAHRTASGGEVRLSLSNPFDERGAEGFRAELFPTDSAHTIAQAMVDLLADCRVEDVTMLADIFPDSDPTTRLPLLFRADALEASVGHALRLH